MSGQEYRVGPPYAAHLTGAQDLVTPHAATRAGFIAMVLEKNRLSSPIIREARELRALASRAKSPAELVDMLDIQAALLTAAGTSDKASNYLTEEDRRQVKAEFVRNFLEPEGDNFAEELTYRFLLIRGDSLGGKMRNLAGALAQRRITESILAAMKLAGRPYSWYSPAAKKWIAGEQLGFSDMTSSQIAEEVVPYDVALADDAPSDQKVNGIAWKTDGRDRVLMFNIRVPFIKQESEGKRAGKNVDMCLLACTASQLRNKTRAQVIGSPASYVALGELKGGIDPAGADEHWKTASGHLNRIRDAFAAQGLTPPLFYVGAAIEKSMAEEMWQWLAWGKLANAANLTNDLQVASVVSWLCNL
jgi:hypothetical protein